MNGATKRSSRSERDQLSTFRGPPAPSHRCGLRKERARIASGAMSLDSGPAPTASAEDAAVYWARKTRRQQWLVNAAWWIETFLPLAFLGALALTALILAGRRAGWPLKILASAGLVVAAGTLAGSFWRARRHFVSGAQARVQLEYALALHTRLTSAADGIGDWPSAAAWKPGLWRWNTRRLVIIPAACLGLLATAFFVSIPAPRKTFPPPMVRPPSLTRVEDWLEKLSRSPAIEPESIEEVRAEAEQLSQQAQQDWYSHASLETAAHLENQMEAGLRSLEQNTTKIADALDAAATPNLSDAQAKAVGGELSGALSALEGNVPSLNRDLAARLSAIDPSKIRTLTPDQLKQLKKRLSECKGACEECLGEDAEGENPSDESLAAGNPGIGGTNRGPGPAELSFSLSGADLGSKKTEALQNDDLSHAALGDRVGLSAGRHEVDKNAAYRAPDGGSAADGAGPEAVWVQRNLTPQEQRQVQQFFK
jgi:hypothetical protein